jgi:hypothetical protein
LEEKMSSISGVGNPFVQGVKNDPAVQQNSAQIVILPPLASAVTSPYDPRINYNVAHGENLPVSSQFSREDVAARLLNPALDPLDSLMLFSYYNDPYCSETSVVTAEQLRQKYISLLSEQMSTYDGKVSPYLSKSAKRVDAFKFALEALGVISSPDLSIYNEVFPSYLLETERTLLDEYRREPSGSLWKAILEEKILSRIAGLEKHFEQAVFASADKKAAGKLLFSFAVLAEASGVSGSEIFIAQAGYSVFGLPSEEINLLYSAYSSADTPEVSDNARLLPEIEAKLLSAYEALYRALKEGWVDVERLDRLVSIVTAYAGALNELGVKLENIMEIKAKAKHRVFGSENAVLGRPGEFANIDAIADKAPMGHSGKKMAYVVSPENLPYGIKRLLSGVKRDGNSLYFDFVKDNLDYLIFSCDTQSAAENLSDMDVGGYLFHFTGIVQIDLPNKERGEPKKSDLSYFVVIVHETQHRFNEKFLAFSKLVNQSAVDEAIAYFEGAKALGLALKSPAGRSDDFKDDLALAKMTIDNDLLTFSGALEIMGLDPDRDPGTHEQMFSMIDLDRDLSTYPTQAMYIAVDTYIAGLRNSGLLTARDSHLRPALKSGIQKLISGVPLEQLSPSERDALNTVIKRANPVWTMEASSLASLRQRALTWDFLSAEYGSKLSESYKLNNCGMLSSEVCSSITSEEESLAQRWGSDADLKHVGGFVLPKNIGGNACLFFPVLDDIPIDVKVLDMVIKSRDQKKNK